MKKKRYQKKKSLLFFSVKRKEAKENQLLPRFMGGKLVFFFVAFGGWFHGVDTIGRPRPINRPVNSGFLLVLFF
ncbi:MAG: hypothetical protein J6K72_09515 [Clostridia bacterium]|nr:hypothetical protein [Clostridia bacterium]